jgi:N-acetyl sugar amidotransferase
MKIFIDINHPAHVHYFRNLINIMQNEGHEFMITARDKEMTHKLLDQYKIKYISRGKGKKSLIGKLIYSFKADYLIYKITKNWKPDIFLSFGSPYPAHVSKILGIPSVSITDTEHASLGLLAFKPFSNVILTPSCFSKDLGSKHKRFNSFMERCYLHPNYFTPDPGVLKLLGISENDKFAIVRFVSWNASHDIGRNGLSNQDKIELVETLSKKLKVFISSEGEIPENLEKYRFNIPSHYMHHALNYASIYVGEGGTTASESALLGTPAIYVNNLSMGYIQKEAEAGLLFQTTKLKEILDHVNTILSLDKDAFNSRLQKLVKDHIDPTAFLISFLKNYGGQKVTGKTIDVNSSEKKQVQCKRCILDTTVGDIWFDELGECKYCKIHDELEKAHPLGPGLEKELKEIVEKIKKDGRGKKYDCIVGVSGGRDSTYTLYVTKQLGLRPLAVHFDNGWNSDISVKNIKNSCTKLNVDLVTVVADWEEFKDLQVAFLKSSTPDADIPTDYAIYSVLYTTAKQEGLKYILNGHSFRTEGTSPISWTYMDPLYVRDVHKKHGKIKKITSFPHMSMMQLQYFVWVKGIRDLRLMEFIDYNKKKVDEVIKRELNWEYYGGHHHENIYTKFFQSYYLPTKFGIDKRKTELSAMIRSGQISREDGLNEIQASPYKYDPETVEYSINKLGISKEEWAKIMASPIRSHNDYTTLLPLIRFMRWPIKMAVEFRVLPQILYLKYAK